MSRQHKLCEWTQSVSTKHFFEHSEFELFWRLISPFILVWQMERKHILMVARLDKLIITLSGIFQIGINSVFWLGGLDLLKIWQHLWRLIRSYCNIMELLKWGGKNKNIFRINDLWTGLNYIDGWIRPAGCSLPMSNGLWAK